MIRLLTLERARTYALLTLAIGCFITISSFIANPEKLRTGTDFPAFYNAGRIVNEHPRGSLYDQGLQRKLRSDLAPGSQGDLFFAYTPFFALPFSLLARLPYVPALILWMAVSIGLFVVGFRLVWSAAGLPKEHWTSGLIVAFSFLPFYAWTVLTGQVAAWGFFWLALAIYLDKDFKVMSGCALAMLLYKPPLLILIVPMLIITKRWRTLAGFVVTGSVLVLLSLAVIGLSGVPQYLTMLQRFSGLTAKAPNFREIDAFSYFLPFVSRPLYAYVLVALMVAVALPFLITAWRQRPDTAWVHAIIWGLVLNFYVLLYDSTLIILAVLLSIGSLGKVPHTFRWLLLALFVAPWFQTDIAKNFGFRPMTVALVAFGCYQLWLSLSFSYKPSTVELCHRR